MSGHNKWSSIKHRKGAQDAKRSKIFTKIIKEITVAARMGGGDPESNPRLRTAMITARGANMPKDNVLKAIKKGEGGDKSEQWENLTYEGYGPHNVAVIVECLTDNRNRTISSVRSKFTKNNGNIGASNSVMYMFDRLGMIEVEKSVIDEDALMELALDAGAEDIETEDDDVYTVKTSVSDFSGVCQVLEEKEIAVKSSNVSLVPQNRIEIDDVTKAQQVIKFIEALEDDDDVQNVFSNFDISEDVLAQLG